MAKPEENDAPEISEEDKKRIQKATTLLAAYTNFMRWAGNFRRDEIKRHPRHGSNGRCCRRRLFAGSTASDA